MELQMMCDALIRKHVKKQPSSKPDGHNMRINQPRTWLHANCTIIQKLEHWNSAQHKTTVHLLLYYHVRKLFHMLGPFAAPAVVRPSISVTWSSISVTWSSISVTWSTHVFNYEVNRNSTSAESYHFMIRIH